MDDEGNMILKETIHESTGLRINIDTDQGRELIKMEEMEEEIACGWGDWFG